MKRTILFLLLALPFYSYSQTLKPIDGFFDIKFGSDAETVQKWVSEKGGKMNEERSTFQAVQFVNLTLGRTRGIDLEVRFQNNMATRATFFYPVDARADIVQAYKRITVDLTKTYGKGVSEITTPPHPGTNIRQDIKSGKRLYFTLWDDPNGHIMSAIDTSLKIIVIYKK